MIIRQATKSDLSQLLTVEESCFTEDRLTRRSFKHFLSSVTAWVQVVEEHDQIQGYSITLFRKGTCLSRLYSLAVLPQYRGKKLAEQLIARSEQYAIDQGCIFLRLEVRTDNQAAITLYQRLNFRTFGHISHYYADGCDAIRMEKTLIRHVIKTPKALPYYKQSTEFTCGPSALMIAMKSLEPATTMDMLEELQIWREATTVFMLAGHGGCSPFGLALSAWKRGFKVQLYASSDEVPFIDSVRDKEKKGIVSQIHHDFVRQIEQTDIEVNYQTLTADKLLEHIQDGMVAITLISTWQFNRHKIPHWIAVTHADEEYVYLSDPEPDEEMMHTGTDNIAVPVRGSDFSQIACYGKKRQKYTLLISL